MATLQQLEEGIRRAHAAGNAEHVKLLGAEYRRLQAQDAAPNPQASQLPGVVGQFQDTSNAVQSGFNQGLTLGFGDEIYAGATAPFRAIPGLFNGEGYDLGKAYESGLESQRTTQKQQAALNPVAAGIGEVSGAVVNPASRLLMPVKGAAPVVNALRGLGGGAATGGVYGFGSAEGDMSERARGGLMGAATGAATGLVAPWLAKKGGDIVEGIAQNRATSQAIKGAPSAAEQAAESSAMFKAVDAAGVTVDTNKFSGLVQNLVTTAKRDRINPTLDAKATAAYQELIGALDDVQKNGGSLTISDLHTLRQIAQKSAMSSEGRDSMFSNRIVDALDSFIGSPGNVKLPANRLGKPGAGGNELLQAISTWSRSRKIGLIENAIEAAKNYPSGVESGLRSQFKTLLNGKNTKHLFSKAEKQAMQGVINGSAPIKALRTLGIFRGLGAALVGSSGGPAGAILAGAAGYGARKITEKATQAAANRAAQVVATPNIPNITVRNPLLQLPPGALALPVIDQQRR
jgi:hypothetical protein